MAECPYQVVTSDPKDARSKKKRRRTEGGDESDATKQHLQTAPFKPSGKFKTCGDMDINYQVKPMKDWAAMTRYNSFVRKLMMHTAPFGFKAEHWLTHASDV